MSGWPRHLSPVAVTEFCLSASLFPPPLWRGFIKQVIFGQSRGLPISRLVVRGEPATPALLYCLHACLQWKCGWSGTCSLGCILKSSTYLPWLLLRYVLLALLLQQEPCPEPAQVELRYCRVPACTQRQPLRSRSGSDVNGRLECSVIFIR